VRKLLFQNFLLRQYLQRQTIAIVFEFDPHFLIRLSDVSCKTNVPGEMRCSIDPKIVDPFTRFADNT